jgi:hypothetical protein
MKNSLKLALQAFLSFVFATAIPTQAHSAPNASQSSVPYQVANILTVGIQTALSQNCMGMFIAPRVVVTAAHCMRSGMPRYVKTMNGKMFGWEKIAEVVSHPQYKGDIEEDPFDISYIVLKADYWGSVEVFDYLKFSGLPNDSRAAIAIAWTGYNNYEFKKAAILKVPSKDQVNYVTDFQVNEGSSGGPLFAMSGDYFYLLGTVRNGAMNFATDSDILMYQLTNDPKYINVKASKVHYSNIRLDNDWLLKDLVAKKLLTNEKLK